MNRFSREVIDYMLFFAKPLKAIFFMNRDAEIHQSIVVVFCMHLGSLRLFLDTWSLDTQRIKGCRSSLSTLVPVVVIAFSKESVLSELYACFRSQCRRTDLTW